MKYTFFLIAAVFFLIWMPSNTTAQIVKFRWDAEHQKETVSGYVKQLTKLPLTEKQITELSTCAKDKFKASYPNGINLAEEKFVELNDGFLSDCLKDAKLVVIPTLTDELGALLTEQIQKNMPATISSETKKKLSGCFVATINEKYPKGFVFKESERQSFQEKLYAISSDCAEKISFNNVLSWNKETESLFKYGLTKTYSKDGTSAYAECVLAKVKIKYPTGYTMNEYNKAELTTFFEQIKKQCPAELKSKN